MANRNWNSDHWSSSTSLWTAIDELKGQVFALQKEVAMLKADAQAQSSDARGQSHWYESHGQVSSSASAAVSCVHPFSPDTEANMDTKWTEFANVAISLQTVPGMKEIFDEKYFTVRRLMKDMRCT